jgi:lipopolysaccharide biosynthesis glycosyltransferase
MDIFTLAIGDHVYGFAALCNSLCAVGFDGHIHVGYRGELRCEIAAGAPIILYELPDDGLRPMNQKPAFLLKHAAGTSLYLDADIIVMNRAILDALSEMVSMGPVFCAEGIVPERDIRRTMWRKAKTESLGENSASDTTAVRLTSMYFNSGLVCGDIGRDRWLISDWNQMIRRTLPANGDGFFEVPYFPMADQDCLNALLQDEEATFSCIGPPDIWYAPSDNNPFHVTSSFEGAILHSIGPKPWRHRSVPLRDPNRYEVAWYRFLSEEMPWVRCRPDLPKAVCDWLRNSLRGRVILKAKRLYGRFAFLRYTMLIIFALDRDVRAGLR